MKQNKAFDCEDCSINILGQNDLNEVQLEKFQYCMLKNNLWAQASNNNKIKMLCLKCIEKRLNRELLPEDFEISPKEMLARMVKYLTG